MALNFHAQPEAALRCIVHVSCRNCGPIIRRRVPAPARALAWLP